jgi:MFS family permease
MLAQSLLVLKLTGRASALGEATAIQAAPFLLLGPFIGPLVDRINLRRVMIVIAIAAGLEASALAALTEAHEVTIWWIFGLSFVLGCINMFNQPAIQAIVPELVPRAAIPSAVSLNGVANAAGRLAGPALAALLYAWKGPATCFGVNALSYVIVIGALVSLRQHELYPTPARRRTRGALKDSFRYAWQSPVHRGQLIANAFVGMFAWNFGIFFASFTQLVLRSGSLSLGFAESINATVAVIGGVILSRHLNRPTRRTYVGGCIALGTALGFTALAPNLIAFYFCMVLFGSTTVCYTAINQSVLQRVTPRERIGSVMTLSTYGTMGTTPVGALIVGWLTTIGTARAAIGAGSASLLISALVLTISARHQRRPLSSYDSPPPDQIAPSEAN